MIAWRSPLASDPDESWPRTASQVHGQRTDRGLAISERPLTPLVDVLAAFCTGAHPELAAIMVLTRVERCDDPGTVLLRWTPSRDVIATLDLPCLADLDDEDPDDITPTRLVLRQRADGWRVVSVEGCGGAP